MLKGEQVPDFAGATEAVIRAYASRSGRLQPIPCQMDERNQWGEFVVGVFPPAVRRGPRGA